MTYRRIDFAGGGGWRSRLGGIVAVAVGLGLAVALLILGLGIAIILLPVVAIAFFIGRWRWKKIMAEAEARRSGAKRNGPMIELDYEVVDRRDDGGADEQRRR